LRLGLPHLLRRISALGCSAAAFLLALLRGPHAQDAAGLAIGPLRYAPLESLLDPAAAPADIAGLYVQRHAPPFPRDLDAASAGRVPPWLLASADGTPRPDRVAHAVLPREADGAVEEFLTENLVLYDRGSDTRARLGAKLLVWMSGTGGTPLDAGLFLPFAADRGYRVIGLEFDSLPAGTALCDNDPDPSCFARYRASRVWGDDDLPALGQKRAEGIVPRLVHLLRLLDARYPDEHWGHYLAGAEPDWSRIVLAGQSMGAGMAAYLAKERRVAGVILSSSPWDHQEPSGALAPWLAAPSATPIERWVGIYHARETMAPMLARSYAALGLAPAQIRVSELVPFALRRAPARSMVFHGCWFGAAVPLDRAWRPTAEVIETWSFLLDH
jgi:hypothetical protein